eukprot:UN17547
MVPIKNVFRSSEVHLPTLKAIMMDFFKGQNIKIRKIEAINASGKSEHEHLLQIKTSDCKSLSTSKIVTHIF